MEIVNTETNELGETIHTTDQEVYYTDSLELFNNLDGIKLRRKPSILKFSIDPDGDWILGKNAVEGEEWKSTLDGDILIEGVPTPIRSLLYKKPHKYKEVEI